MYIGLLSPGFVVLLLKMWKRNSGDVNAETSMSGVSSRTPLALDELPSTPIAYPPFPVLSVTPEAPYAGQFTEVFFHMSFNPVAPVAL
jgi:hypothetical protein